MRALAAIFIAILVNTVSAEPTSDSAKDPFVAAALGAIPFVSGFYVSDKPARGVLFTAVDILMVTGMYTARSSASRNRDNVKVYFAAMGVNNILDAWLSAYYASHPQSPRVLLIPTEGEGFAAALHWTF